MPHEYDQSVEEVSRAIAALFKGARLGPDLADIWRAMGERQMRNRMLSGKSEPSAGGVPDDDPLALAIRANSLVVNALMRIGLDWQRTVSRRVPAIRARLDDYRADDDPLPEVRNALLDEVHLLIMELAEFVSDQGRALQQDIQVFERRLLPHDADGLVRSSGRLVRNGDRFPATVLDARAASARDVIHQLKLESDIARLKSSLKQWRERSDPHIREMLDHQFDGDAKYFRPLTVFGCYRAQGHERIPESLIISAQVVEMFHNVSLIIDDIVDKSDDRRGKPTLQKRYDELTAYMVAGYVVADGYDLLARQVIDECRDRYGGAPDVGTPPPSEGGPGWESRFREPYRVDTGPGQAPGSYRQDLARLGPVRFDMRLLSELLKRLAVAECVQWRHRKQPLGLPDWYWLAREDTGSMFEVCACLGSRDQRLRRFGRLLGMLYHGCDDVADLMQEPDLGGGGDEDLRDGILTLPAALAIRDDRIRALFEQTIGSESERQQDKIQLGKRVDEYRGGKIGLGDLMGAVQALAEKQTGADQRERERIEQLRGAYRAQAEEAHRVLDDLAERAKQEARAHAIAPDPLLVLVDYTRQLAPRRQAV